jgi:hypothetical protein
MEPSAENLERFFPYYFTEERKKGLLRALKDVPSRRYYARIPDPEPLQGDGWRGVPVLRFEDGSRTRVQAVILTNSCDIAGDNARLQSQQINFVPLIILDRYLELLRTNGISAERVDQHARDIRAQLITDIFYLPSDSEAGPERIALLHDIHTVPLPSFQNDQGKERLFSLSDVGFYLFIFKLSVHFCRLHENIDRSMGGTVRN